MYLASDVIEKGSRGNARRCKYKHNKHRWLLHVRHVQTHDQWNGQDKEYGVGDNIRNGHRHVERKQVETASLPRWIVYVPNFLNGDTEEYRAEHQNDGLADDNDEGGDCTRPEPSERRETEIDRQQGDFGKAPTEHIDPCSDPG